MNINEQLLSAITDLLNDDGLNYSVFLHFYTVPINTNCDSNEIICKALGNKTILGGIKTIMDMDVMKEVEVSLSYAGGSGAGPSSAVLKSSTFTILLAQLLSQLKIIIASANKIEQFWLSEGHPSYPVFWDFAFLFTYSNEAVVFIGSSSD